jgi:hypothetical protein
VNPSNPDRAAPDSPSTNGRLHGPPLDAAAIEAHLVTRATEYARRHLRPELRGRGVRQGHRTKDLKRQRPYAATNLLGVLAESLADRRVPTSAVCLLLDELKLDAMLVRGELADVDFDEVMLLETTAQGVTDALQIRASRTQSPGAFAALLTALLREGDVKHLAAAATKRKLEEAERAPVARA